MTEKELEKVVTQKLQEMGAWIMPKTHMSNRGVPDRLVCYRGHFLAIEFKPSFQGVRATKGRIVLQRKTLGEIASARGISYFVYPENAYQFLTYVRSLPYVTRPEIPTDDVLRK